VGARRPEKDAIVIARRAFFHLAAGVAALPVASGLAWAQGYPARNVRIIAPVPPGGTSDMSVRLISQWLSARLGQPFIVENRPGAATNIGTEMVVRAAPDGYTLLGVTGNNATNASVYDKLSFNFIRDIAPVASTIRVPLVLEVNPLVPAKTIPEFIAYAKAQPGRVNMASSGNGAPSHVAGELFSMMAGVKFTHVPYRGDAPAITDLLGGQVQVYFGFLPASIEHIKAGKLRALAVTTAMRLDVLPDIPTVGEFVSGYEATSWNGIGVPSGTPTEVIYKLNTEINAALVDSKIRARFASVGAVPFGGSPAEFGKFIAEEIEKWATVVRFAGIKAE
jgi:tripartite-type tricarboxylate transporter receptor subunit TctC